MGKPSRRLIVAAALVFWVLPGFAQQKPIDISQASKYFLEMKAVSNRDAGHLWGMRLYGPMLFVDPDTGFAVANQQDGEGKLHREGDVFTGQAPPELGVANTAISWAGVTWTMVMWPLPQHRRDRISLMAHESFHRIQPQLGLQPSSDAPNSQLDTRDGRTWLQLEFRSLERALWTGGQERQQAIADALYFRAYRRALFSGSVLRESALEINEGLAEYTGLKLASESLAEMMSLAEITLHLAPQRPTFVRSFAYITGPAYGYLLDQSGKSWRSKLTANGDLGQIAAFSYHITTQPPSEAEAVRRSQAYDGDEIIAIENDREAHRQQAIADAKAHLIDGAVLVLLLGPNVHYTFNPNEVVAIDENMTVYPRTQITDDWGMLQVQNGALLVRSKGHVVRAQVSAPADADSLRGDGWRLDLKPGWKLEKGSRPGDWTVVKTPGR